MLRWGCRGDPVAISCGVAAVGVGADIAKRSLKVHASCSFTMREGARHIRQDPGCDVILSSQKKLPLVIS